MGGLGVKMGVSVGVCDMWVFVTFGWTGCEWV